MTSTSDAAASLETTPVWSWSSKGRSAKVLGTVAVAGVAMVAVGLPLLLTMDKESTGAAGGYFLAMAGLFLLVAAFGLWFNREAVVLRSDGVLERWKRRQRAQELRLEDIDEVALVRSKLQRRMSTGNGRSTRTTIHYLSVVPSSEVGRRRPGHRPPHDWFSLTTFPLSKDDELRQALGQFTKVQAGQ